MKAVEKIFHARLGKQGAAGALLLIGLALRLRQYLTGRSLWLDEAMLALNIVRRDFWGLFRPLDYDQGAPIGFLLVEKTLATLFGDHEFVLRLFPLATGIAALGLFYLLIRRLTSGMGRLAALALFAVSPALVYYASEVKQYSLDVFVTIGLFLLSLPLFDDEADRKAFLWLAGAGVLALWFSHPALFVLGGIGSGLVWKFASERKGTSLIRTLWLGGAWLFNLGILYLVSLRHLRQNAFLMDFWQENFLPLPPWSQPAWFGGVFGSLIRTQAGISLPGLFGVMLVLGWFFLWTKNRPLALAMLGVLGFSLVAAALRMYPFGGRLSLFLVPLTLVLAGHCLSALEERLLSFRLAGSLLSLAIGLALVYAPASDSFQNFVTPKYFEHIRPAISNLAQNWQPGDVLFVSYGATPAFDFYAARYGLGEVTYSTSQPADYLAPPALAHRLEPLADSPRAWILFSHVYERGDFNEKDFLLASLNEMGKKKREFRTPGTSVYLYLYDLR
ncbi:MAG: hypothetical protein Fur0043_12430 [Anaerolineales bacterium]